MRRLTAILWRSLLAVSLLLLLAGGWAWNRVHAPLPGIAAATLIDVRPGAAASAVAEQLRLQGVISSPRLFAGWARFTGSADRLQAGEYQLLPGQSMADVLDLLVAGRVKLHGFTIVEGWTWREVRDALRASDVIRPTAEFDSAEAMARFLPGNLRHAEGRLFPETYAVARGVTDVEVLQQAARLMAARLQAAWDSRAADLPFQNPQQLLTLASIVERETSLDSERAEVAGVFVRRLRQNMRLQTDPTVIYGLGADFDGNLTRRHLRTDTPYNTYTRAGLPPTPIAMPGEASLQAAANPAAGSALFFVASPELDGSHVFSDTLEQHNAAVARYVDAFRRARRRAQ